MRHVQRRRDFAGGKPVRFMADDQPEDRHACGLRQGAEGQDRVLFVHMSRYTDIFLNIKCFDSRSQTQ